MIKLFSGPVDFSDPAITSRDLTTLNNNVNSFIETSQVQPKDVDLQFHTVGAFYYAIIMLEYDIRQT